MSRTVATRERQIRSAALAIAATMAATALAAGRAPLANGWQVYREISVNTAARPAAARHFLSFLEYQDLALYHPRVGYYTSGRVDFGDDFRTFPTALAPYFGHMIAEQTFRMWAGMREAGTLDAEARFTIAEFGGGNGLLAESILVYVDARAQATGDARWHNFARQLYYVAYDRSPALRAQQHTRNHRFGARFEAREGDATDMARAITPGALRGVILSNELLDVFAVHKVILSPDGSGEVAFVAPSLSRAALRRLRRHLAPAIEQRLAADDAAIEREVFDGRQTDTTWMSRDTLLLLVQALSSSASYASDVREIAFREIYLPADAVPAVAAYLARYRDVHVNGLARSRKAQVTYVNPGIDAFMRGAAQALAYGYVVTIDYGAGWSGMLATDRTHLRIHGPDVPQRIPWGQAASQGLLATVDNRRERADPYRGPTLHDITTDVNFGHLADAGERVGLRPAYFGPQRALQAGTPVSLGTPPPALPATQRLDFAFWARDFATNGTFKVLVQQKDGTDPRYAYPDARPEPLR